MERDDGGWLESTEGDLDFDLTEEAGWGEWEEPDRSPMTAFARLAFGLALVGMVTGTIVSLL